MMVVSVFFVQFPLENSLWSNRMHYNDMHYNDIVRPNAIPVPITDFIQTFEDKIAFLWWITVYELILMDKGLLL